LSDKKKEERKNRRVTQKTERHLHPGPRYSRRGGGGDHQRSQDQEWTIAAHHHPSPSPLQALEEISNIILRVSEYRGGTILIASLRRPPAQPAVNRA